jgi:hypothetical protein
MHECVVQVQTRPDLTTPDPQDFARFVEFVDRLIKPDDFMEVASLCARAAAHEVRWQPPVAATNADCTLPDVCQGGAGLLT